MVSAVDIATLLKPINGPLAILLVAQPNKAAALPTALKGANKPPAKAPKPPRKIVRRLGSDTS